MLKRLFYIALIFTSSISYSQTLEELEAELAALEMQLDSFGIMDLLDEKLLDSLLQLDEPQTEINIGFGYTSQVVTAGQTLGIDQYGLNPSLSFYHKSGAFANYTGYFSSDSDPQYFLHNLSLGYMGNIGTKWNYSASYMRQIYVDTENPLENSLNFSGTYNIKRFSASLSYSRYFGDQSSNMLMPSISMFLIKPDFLFFKSVSIFPIISLSYANPNLLYSGFSETYIKSIWYQEALVNLTEIERLAIFGRRVPQEIADEYYDGDRIILARTILEGVDFVENTTFGLTSTAFSLPIILEFSDQFNVTLSYTYIIPENLVLGTISEFEEPITTLAEQYDRLGDVIDTINETNRTISFDIENTGFFGINLSYSIPIKN